MSGYTQDEIQAAVEKLVQSTVRRTTTVLGIQDQSVSFSDIQQAAAGVFLLYPNAPYYVVALGASRLVSDVVAAETVLVQALLETFSAVGRQVLPVDDVSTLFNAKAALQELGGAAAARGSGFKDITSLPAYQRFTDNVGRFLSGPGQNVRQAGSVVQTPQEARAAIPALMNQLLETHALLVARVSALVNALVDYDRLNLPSMVAADVLSKSAALIGADADALASLSPQARLEQVRQVVLNLLASKSVVATFGSFSGPSDFYEVTGQGFAYSDASRPATPAVLKGLGVGAVGITQGVNDGLSISADGSPPVSLVLPASFLATLETSLDDSHYVIGDGISPVQPAGYQVPNNNVLKVKVGGASYAVTLGVSDPPVGASLTGTGNTTTSGWYGGGGSLNGKTLVLVADSQTIFTVTLVAPANAAALVSQINAVTNVGGGQHNLVASVAGNRLVLTTANTGSGASVATSSGSALAILGLTAAAKATGSNSPRAADSIAFDIATQLPSNVFAKAFYFPLEYSGPINIPAGTDTTWTIPAGATDLVQLGVQVGDTVKVLSGDNAPFISPILAVTSTSITVGGSFLLQNNAPVEIGPKHRRVRIACVDPVDLDTETTISVFSDSTVSKNALATLGFSEGAASSCRRSTVDSLASYISGVTTVVSATAPFTPNVGQDNLLVRTELLNPSQVVFAQASGVGSTSFSSTVVTFTVTSADGIVQLGDVLVLRSGPNLDFGFIQTVNGAPVPAGGHLLEPGDIIVADGFIPGTSSSNVTFETGPQLTDLRYEAVNIASGVNAGLYYVDRAGASPIDVLLQRPLPMNFQGQQPLTMTASYGTVSLALASKDKTTASVVAVSGTAVPTLFLAVTVFGESPWFKLPQVPRGLQPGDLLEYYATLYNEPTVQYVITSVDAAGRVLGLSPEFPVGTTINFSSTRLSPFGRLRVGKKLNFNGFQTKAKAWLAGQPQQPSFFSELNRKVNPLLVNKNPTAAQVGAAVQQLNQLYALLSLAGASALNSLADQTLEQVLDDYAQGAEAISPVDALLRSFAEKGSNRAVDLLLQGQFSTFFSLTMDGASYAGAFQAATRAVAMNDLPVRRYNRIETVQSQLVAQAESPDFEFTGSDLNETVPGPQVDPPSDFGEPNNFGRTT